MVRAKTKKSPKKSKKVLVNVQQPAKEASVRPRRVAAAKQAFNRHYYSLMPDKKHHRVAIWVVFLFVVAVIAAQMMYPVDRAVPFARLGKQSVGWQSEIDLSARVGEMFQEATVRLMAGNKTTEEYPLATTGADAQVAQMVTELVQYPFWQRFIPGSIVWQRPEVNAWSLSFSERQLSEFAAARSRELSYEPVNAKLEIRDGFLVAVNDVAGSRTTTEQVRVALGQSIAYGKHATLKVETTTLPPAKTSQDLEAVRSQAEAALRLPISIQADGHTITPNQNDKASWLRLSEDGSGQTVLQLDHSALNAYLDERSKEVGRPAGQTRITIQNGHEVAREEGAAGTKINNQPLVELIGDYLLNRKGRPPFIAEMVAVAPTVIYNNSYTATEAGLRAYVTDQSRRGAWISIRQLNGERWSADARATESVVSGSTYKLYVALYLFKEMEEGKRGWGTPILDTDTNTCFNRMTIASTNPCAEEWLRQFGRSNVNNYLYSRGFSQATTFTNPEASHTSALDLTNYMIGLEQGTLMPSAYRERLLSSLARHPYRYGIPTGSKGQVWDKVGFVWNYVNDAAIVHHPRGTYAMTIMTRGKSYAAIATMTREIEKIMYP